MSAGDRNPLATPPRERLFAEIASRLDPDRIIEVHHFAPRRQGDVESGVAVVAATRPPTEESPESAAHSDSSGVSSSEETVEESRRAVYTASYRLTLKGPERGKWEMELRDEADAPLETIVTVVRGVQERSGEAEDADRIDAARFREIAAGATTL